MAWFHTDKWPDQIAIFDIQKDFPQAFGWI